MLSTMLSRECALPGPDPIPQRSLRQRSLNAAPPAAQGALNAHVVKDGELQRYLLFYEAVAADGRRSIGLAASEDGIRGWARLHRCRQFCLVVPGFPSLRNRGSDLAFQGICGWTRLDRCRQFCLVVPGFPLLEVGVHIWPFRASAAGPAWTSAANFALSSQVSLSQEWGIQMWAFRMMGDPPRGPAWTGAAIRALPSQGFPF